MPIPTLSAVILPLTKAAPAGVIYLDVDPAAERVLVFDRFYMQQFWHSRIASHLKNGKVPVIVPVEYTSASALAAVIFDEHNIYNLAGVDRITADPINLTTTSI